MTTDPHGGFKLITPDNSFGAELTVPTRSDGATLSKSGWEIGGDNITRTTSKGSIEENPYEDIVSKFIIYSDHIEMGVMLENGTNALSKTVQGKRSGAKRTIRIPMTDVTDVRTETVGGQENPFGGDKLGAKESIAFETAEDVYQLIIYRETDTDGILDRVVSGKITIADGEIRDQAVQKIEDSKGPAITNESENKQNKSIADDLERINDLHEKGVLTDEEFKNAKERLLE